LICPARVIARASRRNCSWVAQQATSKRWCQFALQPVVDGRVGLDGELAHQRIAVQVGQLAGFARRAHVEVHQAAAQVAAVHPFGDRLVVRVGHQQRQAEAAQQAFRGPFPVALVVAHLEQLAGEGHVVRR
jgi:hypothetical protein